MASDYPRFGLQSPTRHVLKPCCLTSAVLAATVDEQIEKIESLRSKLGTLPCTQMLCLVGSLYVILLTSTLVLSPQNDTEKFNFMDNYMELAEKCERLVRKLFSSVERERSLSSRFNNIELDYVDEIEDDDEEGEDDQNDKLQKKRKRGVEEEGDDDLALEDSDVDSDLAA